MTPLDILPATDRLISLQYRVQDASLSKSINLEWSCTDILGEPYRFEEIDYTGATEDPAGLE